MSSIFKNYPIKGMAISGAVIGAAIGIFALNIECNLSGYCEPDTVYYTRQFESGFRQINRKPIGNPCTKHTTQTMVRIKDIPDQISDNDKTEFIINLKSMDRGSGLGSPGSGYWGSAKDFSDYYVLHPADNKKTIMLNRMKNAKIICRDVTYGVIGGGLYFAFFPITIPVTVLYGLVKFKINKNTIR
jgi:hypothetical protein